MSLHRKLNFVVLLESVIGRIDSVAERALTQLERVLTDRFRHLLFILMAVIFVGGFAYALFSNPGILRGVNASALAAIGLLSFPAILLITVVRYQLLGLASGKNMSLLDAARVVVTGIAANMLPLPGSIMVRAAGLTENGRRFARASRFSLAATFVWLGIALVFSATFGYILGLSIFGTAALLAGILVLVIGLGTFPQDTVKGFPSLIVASNGLLMLLMTAQYWLAFAATGSMISVSQAAFLTICGPIGVVIAIAPAGIGVTELSAAALAILVGVEPSTAFVALALSRIMQLVVTSALAFALARARAL